MNRRFFNKILSCLPALYTFKIKASEPDDWIILTDKNPENKGFILTSERLINSPINFITLPYATYDLRINTPDGRVLWHPNWVEFSASEIEQEKKELLAKLKQEGKVLEKIHIIWGDKHRLMVTYRYEDDKIIENGRRYSDKYRDMTYCYTEQEKQRQWKSIEKWRKV
jgi:hypothetical protein